MTPTSGTAPGDGVPGIVLAAGAGRRIGRPKALLEWEGRSFVRAVAGDLHAAGCRPVIVVTGATGDEVAAHLPEGVVREHNPRWKSGGMISSIRAGLRAAGPGASGYLIALVDQPFLGAEPARRLIAAHRREPGAVLVAGHLGRRGHPLLLPARLYQAASTARLPGGLRELVRADPTVRVVEAGPQVLLDIDRPGDVTGGAA